MKIADSKMKLAEPAARRRRPSTFAPLDVQFAICKFQTAISSRSLSRRAFTLVELLVVITIIVALLSLLTPALDQAIYEAELASCAAQVKGMTTGGLAYAAGQARHYPVPPDGRRAQHQPDELGRLDTPAQDMRTVLEGHIPLKAHLCPLTAGKIDLSYDANGPDTTVFGTYELWFAMAYNPANGGRGAMRRIGDRFGWQGPQHPLKQFNVLVNDVNIYLETAPFHSQTGHADRDGVEAPAVFQDEGAGEAFVAGGGAVPVLELTVSRWAEPQSAYGTRGAIDQSYGFDDGSVRIIKEIKRPDRTTAMVPGLHRVPNHQGGTGPYIKFLPAAE
jgi:prepilin-type N-terminal cleavage/methylation domain-containing protein